MTDYEINLTVVFPDLEIVPPLVSQLSWMYSLSLILLKWDKARIAEQKLLETDCNND